MKTFILLLLIPYTFSNNAVCYLSRYGYLQSESKTQNISSALKTLQETFSLTVDGTLNDEVLTFMKIPRCGNNDDLLPFTANPLRKWVNTTIKWFMYGGSFYDHIVERGFSLWAKHTNLVFHRDFKNPNILLGFYDKRHMNYAQQNTCMWDLDGVGGTLAHAFLPDMNTTQVDIHFDRAERWDFSMNLPRDPNTSFYLTLLHEIGHTLGLSHSYVNESVMYPIYQSPVGISNLYEYDLHKDDIQAIQFLYGKPANVSSTISTTSTTVPIISTTTERATKSTSTISNTIHTSTVSPSTQISLDICTLRFEIKTFLVVNNHLYVFFRKYVWILSLDHAHRTSEQYTQPKVITDWLSFLPETFTQVSAIYQKPNDEIVLFTNRDIYYISYPSLELLRTENINNLGKHVSKVVSALNTNTGKTFIIGDDGYHLELNECTGKTRFKGSLSNTFSGVPNNIKGAFRYINGCLYFQTDSNVLEYNEFTGSVTKSMSDLFDVLGITCIRETLLRQLYSVLRYMQ